VFQVYRRCGRRLAEGCCNFEAAIVLNVYEVNFVCDRGVAMDFTLISAPTLLTITFNCS
jgi:hypothetical protein